MTPVPVSGGTDHIKGNTKHDCDSSTTGYQPQEVIISEIMMRSSILRLVSALQSASLSEAASFHFHSGKHALLAGFEGLVAPSNNCGVCWGPHCCRKTGVALSDPPPNDVAPCHFSAHLFLSIYSGCEAVQCLVGTGTMSCRTK